MGVKEHSRAAKFNAKFKPKGAHMTLELAAAVQGTDLAAGLEQPKKAEPTADNGKEAKGKKKEQPQSNAVKYLKVVLERHTLPNDIIDKIRTAPSKGKAQVILRDYLQSLPPVA